MIKEIEIACEFMAGYLPIEEQHSFMLELHSILMQSYQGHWYPEQPIKGSAYRCIQQLHKPNSMLNRLSHYSLDRIPRDFVLWIDPNSVSYKVGANYVVTIWNPTIEIKKSVIVTEPLSPPLSLSDSKFAPTNADTTYPVFPIEPIGA
jgi:hypothetical protein